MSFLKADMKRFFVAAGTSHYNENPGADLPSVADDLARVTQCFESLGYQRVLVEVSKEPQSDPLRLALSNWVNAPERTRLDKFVFYYSGHGESTTDRQYLLMANSNLHQLAATAFPAEDLARLILPGSTKL